MPRRRNKKHIIAQIQHIEEGTDRSFDIAFWSRYSDSLRFKAAWELVVEAWQIKRRNPNELRLQRSIATFKHI